jgi:hypothetical protein
MFGYVGVDGQVDEVFRSLRLVASPPEAPARRRAPRCARTDPCKGKERV